uniref:Uncharacterized protein n=1 Tax=Chromera velia CCMP2878 TaxID=1169474 RepID=A0A0G4HUW0_9ALVE|eukprot:Cvel_31982.t1-p1 / transcript=Cvel_31982.t1 / gene=Cvel_31982 / organism=Chromera_velia_CCMP2878 / gene_product=hypothetical protein / transcript_product=hypothetical protein / location=Cvel_scaffold4869:1543-1752(-) / protein_length=70 / sequence_SO=supercontig / SO=protein_coding / is_pseudo=false
MLSGTGPKPPGGGSRYGGLGLDSSGVTDHLGIPPVPTVTRTSGSSLFADLVCTAGMLWTCRVFADPSGRV